MMPTTETLIVLFGFWCFISGSVAGAFVGLLVAMLIRNAGETSRWEERRAEAKAMDELAKRRQVG